MNGIFASLAKKYAVTMLSIVSMNNLSILLPKV